MACSRLAGGMLSVHVFHFVYEKKKIPARSRSHLDGHEMQDSQMRWDSGYVSCGIASKF